MREPLMDAAEVARFLGISKDKVYRLSQQGLPVLRVGRRWRCRPEDLDRWLRGEDFAEVREPDLDDLLKRLSAEVVDVVEPLPGGARAIEELRERWATILAARDDRREPG